MFFQPFAGASDTGCGRRASMEKTRSDERCGSCAVGRQQVGLEVGLEGRGEGQQVDAVDRRTGRNRPTTQLLQRKH